MSPQVYVGECSSSQSRSDNVIVKLETNTEGDSENSDGHVSESEESGEGIFVDEVMAPQAYGGDCSSSKGRKSEKECFDKDEYEHLIPIRSLDDYVPETDYDSDTSDSSSDGDHDSMNSECTENCNQKENIKVVDEKFSIIVSGCNNKPRQKFDKKDCCPYCEKFILSTSFLRHVNCLHGDEEDVKQINTYLKGSQERRKSTQLLRNKGNHINNRKVISQGGHLIVVQRPVKTIDITNDLNHYIVCNQCLGYYSATEMWRHSCPASDGSKETKVRRVSLIQMADLTLTEEQNMFFARMKADSLSQVAREDDALLKMISDMILRKGMNKYFSISQKVRSLSNFLIFVRDFAGNTKLSYTDLIQPANFHLLRNAIMKMFNYKVNVSSRETDILMEKPSSLKRLGQTISQIAEVIQNEAYRNLNFAKAKEIKAFLKLFDHEVTPLMTNAHKFMKCSKSGMPQNLPKKSDVIKIKKYMADTIQSTPRSSENMRLIKEVTLAFLILFNRRRSSEVAKLDKKTWEDRSIWKDNAREEWKKLNEEERKTLESLELVYVRGKCNNFVPILFPKEVVPIMKWLTNSTNKYIFSNNCGNFIRGHDAVRKVGISAKVEDVSLITSTKYRKLAATTLQLQNYTESEYRFICNHLGHTLAVHERFYRLRGTAVEMTKVAGILQDDYMNIGNEGTTNRENTPTKKESNRKPARRWTKEQTAYIRMRFCKEISSNKAISKEQASSAIKKMPLLLQKRTWTEVKNKVRNESARMKKK